MTYSQFKPSILLTEPPPGLNALLKALWFDAKNDWENAHIVIQDIEGPDAAWIHAYLHRKEGDIPNADYWYRRAGRTRPPFSLEEEWEEMATAFTDH